MVRRVARDRAGGNPASQADRPDDSPLHGDGSRVCEAAAAVAGVVSEGAVTESRRASRRQTAQRRRPRVRDARPDQFEPTHLSLRSAGTRPPEGDLRLARRRQRHSKTRGDQGEDALLARRMRRTAHFARGGTRTILASPGCRPIPESGIVSSRRSPTRPHPAPPARGRVAARPSGAPDREAMLRSWHRA